MLVAIADVALVVAAAGALVVTLALVTAVIVAAGVFMLQRRTAPQRESVVRRRA